MGGDDNLDTVVGVIVDAVMENEEEVTMQGLEEAMLNLYLNEQTMLGELAKDDIGLRMLPKDW